ncbi:MAG: hypothetical protein MI924_17645 [Chloroflexales bacterium]|nr:hypothetical protein [Chloroflexales bacterium]
MGFVPPEVDRLRHHVLHQAGSSPPELRQAVEAFVAAGSGGERDEQPIPADLQRYIEKLALYAYKITDEDMTRLKAAGYSEEAIFELTIAGAVGAAYARLEKGLQLLQGEDHAIKSSGR